jgi:hypothetical protein
MDRPVTDQPAISDDDWLIDAPALAPEALERVTDRAGPHRLAWNTFRTLALWERDAWIPPLLEIACGPGNRLSPLDWTETSVVPWAAGTDATDFADVVLDGPQAYVVFACTVIPNPADEDLRAAAVAALDGSVHGMGRDAGLVVVAPPGSDDMLARLEVATGFELRDGRIASELLAEAMSWISWPELGRLALDLAEESDPGAGEQVRRLVSELQARYPAADW